jgi:hypothetical protein
MQACFVHIEPAELQACFRTCPGVSEETGTCAEVPQSHVCRDVPTQREGRDWTRAGNSILAVGTLVVIVVTLGFLSNYKCEDCSLLDPDKH